MSDTYRCGRPRRKWCVACHKTAVRCKDLDTGDGRLWWRCQDEACGASFYKWDRSGQQTTNR